MAAKLTTEIWVSKLQENPIPDHSFVNASQDLSAHVNNDVIHLQEAGVDPGVHIDYFDSTDDDLPIANVDDIPSEVVLKTYSTEQTKHRNLEEVELAYNKMTSVIQRHKNSLAKTLGKSAAYSWSPATQDTYNKKTALGSDSFIDAIIDMRQFFSDLDMIDDLNICLSADHVGKLYKEDKDLYKAIFSKETNRLYGFKVYEYSQTPIFTSAGAKKPLGSTLEAGDTRCSFMWSSKEVFRSMGSVQVYPTYKHSGQQADLVSFAQRALLGNIRASAPKYRGVIH